MAGASSRFLPRKKPIMLIRRLRQKIKTEAKAAMSPCNRRLPVPGSIYAWAMPGNDKRTRNRRRCCCFMRFFLGRALQGIAGQRLFLSHPCLKAGDSSIRSWGAFGSLLRLVSLDSAINGGDCARPVFSLNNPIIMNRHTHVNQRAECQKTFRSSFAHTLAR